MFEKLLKFRFMAVGVVVLASLHALAFMFLGAKIAFQTYWHIVTGSADSGEGRPGLELLHSLDYMLVSLVMMILAVGVAKLFLGSTETRPTAVPLWLDIETFGDLKILLWETILTALLVIGLSGLSAGLFGRLTWTALVIPAAILLLSLSLYFMKRARSK